MNGSLFIDDDTLSGGSTFFLSLSLSLFFYVEDMFIYMK